MWKNFIKFKSLLDNEHRLCIIKNQKREEKRGSMKKINKTLKIDKISKNEEKAAEDRLILRMIIEDYKRRIRFIENHTDGDAYTIKQYTKFIECLEEIQNSL